MSKTTMYVTVEPHSPEASRLIREFETLGFSPYRTKDGFAVPQVGGGKRKKKPKRQEF